MSDLPPGWEWATLGELLQVKYGKSLSQAKRSRDAPFPVVASAGVMAFTTEPLTSGPAIIIGRKGNIGSIQVFDDDSWPIDTVFYAKVPAGMDARFLAYQLQHLQLSRYDSSTSTPSLRREDLESVRLTVPPIAEQRRIVAALEDHLSRLDAGINYFRSCLRKAKQLRASVLENELHRKIDREVQVLGDLGTVITGNTPNSKIFECYGGDIPFVTPADVGNGEKVSSSSRSLTEAGARAGRMLAPGAVLTVCIGATLGKVGWVDQPVCTNQQINAIQPDLDTILAQFLSYSIACPSTQKMLKAAASSTTFPILNKSKFSRVPIWVPPLNSQNQIVERIEVALSGTNRNTAAMGGAIRRQDQLRTALLAEAFVGRLVFQDSGDEPASMLLERIRAERGAQPRLKRNRRTKPSDVTQKALL